MSGYWTNSGEHIGCKFNGTNRTAIRTSRELSELSEALAIESLEARVWRPETEDQNLDAHRKAPLGSGGVLYNSKWPTSKQIAQSENPSFHVILYYNKFFEAFLWYILVFEKLSSSSLFLGTPKGLKGARRCSPTRLAKKSYPFTLRHLAIQIFCGYDRQWSEAFNGRIEWNSMVSCRSMGSTLRSR